MHLKKHSMKLASLPASFSVNFPTSSWELDQCMIQLHFVGVCGCNKKGPWPSKSMKKIRKSIQCPREIQGHFFLNGILKIPASPRCQCQTRERVTLDFFFQSNNHRAQMKIQTFKSVLKNHDFTRFTIPKL